MGEAAVASGTGLRPARMVFVKLIVSDLDGMVGFFKAAFGLEHARTIEMPGLQEAVMTRPGDPKAPSLILYRHTDGRSLQLGTAHGPVGLAVEDVDRAYAVALEHGARAHREPFDVPGMRIAFVLTPEGHEIELIRFG